MPFPTDQRCIARAEQALGRALPAAFTSRLLRSNGGSLEADGDDWTLHPVLDDTDRRRLKRTCNDIVRETASARECHGFPAAALAIAANGAGDYLVLLPAQNAHQFGDAVYVWEHETGKLREIASRFDQLVEDRE